MGFSTTKSKLIVSIILLLLLVVEDKDNAVTGKIDAFRCPFAMRGFEVEMLGEKQSIFVQQQIVTSKIIACFRDKLIIALILN